MTCDEVRDHLIEIGTDELGSLEPHLRSCPACAALAEAVVRTEDDLRTHLETTMTTLDLDSKWDAATAAVPARSNRWLHGGLIGLAAAAVLAVAVWSGGPSSEDPVPDPEGQRAAASLVLGDALDAVDAFDDIEIVPFDDDLGRAEQDAYLKDLLGRKSTALVEAEDALLDAAEDPDPAERAVALLELGDLYLRMGTAVLELPRPTYLDEEQMEFYEMAMEDKASAQWLKAESTLELGLALAEEHALDAEADWLDEALDDTEDLLLSLEPTPEEMEAIRMRDGDNAAAMAELPGRIDEAERTLAEHADCLDAGSLEEVQMILTQARLVVDAGEADMAGSIHQLLDAYMPALDRAISDCDAPPIPSPVVGDGNMKSTIERYSGQLQYCYETALRDQPELAGTVELSWTLNAGAVVGTPSVLTDTTGATDDTLTRCMTDKIRRWSFGADSSGEVVWPFVFRVP